MTWSSSFVRACACCLCLLAWSRPAAAEIITSPPGANIAGTGMGNAPFSNVGDTNGNRYQQIYSADFFRNGGATQAILSVAFRPKQGALGTFIGSRLTISDITVQLSTTSRNANTDFPNGLSGDLPTNVGPDVRTVFSGPLTLTTDRQFGDPDVENFDFLITFTNPFIYSPSQGNLLLDVIIPSTGRLTSNGTNFTQLDNFTDGFPSRDGTASAFDANLNDGITVGANSTTGAVTQFVTTEVPEPTALALWSALAIAGAGCWPRVRRWRARPSADAIV